MLGSGFNKWQFHVPIEASKTQGVGNVIGTISLENTKVRALVDNIEKLITVCLPPEEVERTNDWTRAVSSYREGMKILRKKEGNYNDAEIKAYQVYMNIFGNLWVSLHQQRGLTNYIHLVILGHILEYMREWGNLYKYSQQGWESLNSFIKRFFPADKQGRR